MKLVWDFHELTDFADNLKVVSPSFSLHAQKATKEVAKVLLKHMRELTPRGKTSELVNGWNGNSFLVKVVEGGYLVEIVNTTEYAKWVNDGHKAYNQFGGPYPINPDHRVKVTSPYQWQKGDPTYYVYGHFFVERGILQLNNTDKIEQIIMKELQKWWVSI